MMLGGEGDGIIGHDTMRSVTGVCVCVERERREFHTANGNSLFQNMEISVDFPSRFPISISHLPSQPPSFNVQGKKQLMVVTMSVNSIGATLAVEAARLHISPASCLRGSAMISSATLVRIGARGPRHLITSRAFYRPVTRLNWRQMHDGAGLQFAQDTPTSLLRGDPVLDGIPTYQAYL